MPPLLQHSDYQQPHSCHRPSRLFSGARMSESGRVKAAGPVSFENNFFHFYSSRDASKPEV
jgi:hypothetical protein